MYVPGIVYDLKVGDLEDAYGCSLCYYRNYSYTTTTADIDSCTSQLTNMDGTPRWTFFGALWGSYTRDTLIAVGAGGVSSRVNERTSLNSPMYGNGAWFYFTPGYSFGFAESNIISQSLGPDRYSLGKSSRISWNLDCPYGICGGWRVGTQRNLNNDNN